MMAIHYFPRIDEYTASLIIQELVNKTASEASMMSSTTHPDAFYYATAAIHASELTLKEFRTDVMEIAGDLGFPAPLNQNRARELDQRLSEVLYQKLELVPAEAANSEVWNFLTLVVLPDIAKWRYPNEKKILDYNRWLGGDRNVIRKLWWREATLGHDLNSRLGEDEAVGIMERPLLGGQVLVARAMVRALLKVEVEYPHAARSELMRAGAVNLRRYAPFTAFEFFAETEIDAFVLKVFQSSSHAYVEKQRKLKAEALAQESDPAQEIPDLEKPSSNEDNQTIEQLLEEPHHASSPYESSVRTRPNRQRNEKPSRLLDFLRKK